MASPRRRGIVTAVWCAMSGRVQVLALGGGQVPELGCVQVLALRCWSGWRSRGRCWRWYRSRGPVMVLAAVTVSVSGQVLWSMSEIEQVSVLVFVGVCKGGGVGGGVGAGRW